MVRVYDHLSRPRIAAVEPSLDAPVVDPDVLAERDVVADEARDPHVRLAGEPRREGDLAEDPKMVLAHSFPNCLQPHDPGADRAGQRPSRGCVPVSYTHLR